jgi:signal transduction histidine kinase
VTPTPELLYRANRTDTYGTLTSGFLHDLRSPLQGIQLSAQLLPDEDDLTVARELGEAILPAATHLQSLCERIPAMMAPPPDLDPTPVPVADLMARLSACAGMQRALPGAVTVETGADLVARGVEGWLEHALLNLVINAREAVEGVNGGSVRVEAEADERLVRFLVTDNGGGIAPAVEGRIFDAFVTGRDGRHLGIGLTVARDLARRMDGTIEHEAGGGSTVFVLAVPAWR